MADDDQPGEKQRVLIAGAGVAGLEATLALRDLAGERVSVTLCDPAAEFVYRPFAIGEPYGTTRSLRFDLQSLGERCGARLHRDSISIVDPLSRRATTSEGEQFDYDYLLVATGARMLEAVAGAVTYQGLVDEGPVGELFGDLRAGNIDRVVLTMPDEHGWMLPLYDLALLAGSEAAPGTRVSIVTPERMPLGIFGRCGSDQVATLLAERDIEVIASMSPVAFEAGQLRNSTGGFVEADAVVSLPRLEGRSIDGVSHDRDGFIGVDRHGAVAGQECIYAAGDVCAFPLKQGGVGSEQADAAAEAIAAAAGASVERRPFDPVLRWVLWPDKEPRYLQGGLGEQGVEASGLSERPWEQAHGNPKITAHYLTPLFDSLVSGGDLNGSHHAVTQAPPAS